MRQIKALSQRFNLGLILTVLWGVGAGPTPAAQARDNQYEGQVAPAHHVPRLQAGTGFVRVAISGSDGPGCGTDTSPCATIQFAVDQANSGEEILIAAGTYSGVQVRNGLAQTVYISNTAGRDGGRVAAMQTATLTNIRFERNMAGFDGGGRAVSAQHQQ